MRAACVHIPHFYIQAAIQKDPQLHKKSIIMGTPGDNGCVIDCSEELIEKGLSLSMSLKHSRRLCPDVVSIPFAKEYAAIWDKFLLSLTSVIMRIESDDPGMAFFDITRLPGIYKSEEQLAYAVVNLARKELQMEAHVGMGNSRFIARIAAMFASPVFIISPGTEKKFLSSLSVEQLPVSTEIKERLNLLGLHTLKQIGPFTLPALMSQFGGTGKIIWEIVNGIEEKDRIPCAFAVTDIDQEMVCDSEVYTKEQIRATLAVLLEKLCQELEDTGMACRKLNLVFDLQNRSFLEWQYVFRLHTVCHEDMQTRIMNSLEQSLLPSPIRIMSVRASDLTPYDGRQENLFRTHSERTQSISNASSYLKTKYGYAPVVKIAEKNANTLIPDDRFIFVEP